MAYIPVSQRTGTAQPTGYIPVAQRVVAPPSTPIDYRGTLGDTAPLFNPIKAFTTKTSTAPVADPNDRGLKDLPKNLAQGLARIPAEFAITAGQAGLSIFDKANGTNLTVKTDTGVPTGSLSWLLGKEPVKGYGSDILDLKQTIEQSPLAQKYGLDKQSLSIAFPLTVGFEALNFFGGEAKGAAAFMNAARKIPNTADGVADAYKLMRGAGFEHDIATQYAPLFAKETTAKGTQAITEAAVKLQNTTKPAAYTPVASRVSPESARTAPLAPELAPLAAEAQKVNEARGLKVSEVNSNLLTERKYSINGEGYPVANFKGKVVPLHDLVLGTEKAPGLEIDHINGNKLDNRIENLQVISHKANISKMGLSSRNTSGVKGVKWDNRINKWIASIAPDGKTVHLGSYADMGDAIKARAQGEAKYFEPLYNKVKPIKAPKVLTKAEQDLADMRSALDYMKDTVSDMPGKQLVKYVSRQTGDLPELGKTTANGAKSGSKFARSGDTLTQEILGQELTNSGDVVKAQQLLDEYRGAKARFAQMEAGYKQAVKEARSQKIIDAMGIKIEKARQALIEFDKKYPKLLQATQRLSEAEVRGARVGYQVGKQVERTKILDQLRTTQANTASIREQIVNYARENLPLNERGKLITLIRDAKNQKDLVQAFVRIDNKVREIELSKAITTLKDTAGKLTESPAISADYRNKVKDIIDQYELTGHTNATIAKLEATQAYLDRTLAAGEDTSIPQRILDKLKILSRTPKDKLVLSQVQGLQNEIELLGKLGETKWSTKQALYEGEKDLRKQALLGSATPLNARALPKTDIGTKPSAWADRYIKVRNYFQKTRVGLTPIEGLADITGMQPMKEALDLNFGNYLTHNAASDAKWLDLTKGFTSKEYERIGAIAISKQAGGIERLANSGITQAEVDAITLTAEEQKAYDFVRSTFESEYPAVKKYALDTYNADVGQVDNYVSFVSDFDAMSDLEMYDRFGQRAEEALRRTKTVEQGFTKERTALSPNKLELNIDKIFRRHTDDVAYMLNMGHDIKQYSEIVNFPEMRAKLGDTGTLAWLQYLDLMARKGGTEGAKRIAALDVIRKNLGAGVLGFRISSALVQFTSFTDTVATIGAGAATRGASHIATSREWRNFVMDNFPEVKKAVGDDIAFREFGESFMGRLQQKGMAPLQFMDGLMRSTAAAGHYEKLALERGIKIDLAHPDKGLIAEATKSMRQSQGSSFFKDQPLALTTGYGLADNKSLNKTILTFQSFMLNRWDNMQRQIWRLGIKEGNYGKAAASVFWMVIVASAMEEGIRRGTRAAVNFVTGDSQPEQSFAGNAVLNVVQTVPIMGSLVSAMTYSSNPVPVINAFEDTLSGAGSVVNGKAINTKARGAVQATGAAGSLLGIPGSSQAAQLIRKAIPQATGKKTTNTGLPSLPSLPALPALPKPPSLPKL